MTMFGVLKDSGLRLAIEALEHLGLSGVALGKGFNRHQAADALVLGAVNDSHAAAAQNTRYLVLTYLLNCGCIHRIRPRSIKAETVTSEGVTPRKATGYKTMHQ